MGMDPGIKLQLVYNTDSIQLGSNIYVAWIWLKCIAIVSYTIISSDVLVMTPHGHANDVINNS
jgi:hypothetical protein